MFIQCVDSSHVLLPRKVRPGDPYGPSILVFYDSMISRDKGRKPHSLSCELFLSSGKNCSNNELSTCLVRWVFVTVYCRAAVLCTKKLMPLSSGKEDICFSHPAS